MRWLFFGGDFHPLCKKHMQATFSPSSEPADINTPGAFANTPLSAAHLLHWKARLAPSLMDMDSWGCCQWSVTATSFHTCLPSLREPRRNSSWQLQTVLGVESHREHRIIWRKQPVWVSLPLILVPHYSNKEVLGHHWKFERRIVTRVLRNVRKIPSEGLSDLRRIFLHWNLQKNWIGSLQKLQSSFTYDFDLFGHRNMFMIDFLLCRPFSF